VLAAELRQAVGCLCEVRRPDNNKLVILGRIQNFDGRAVWVYPIGGKEAPPVICNDEFKLVLRITGRPALVWRGQIRNSSPSFWALDRLVHCHRKEQRGNFRQTVFQRANVLCVNALYPHSRRGEDEYYARLCKVMDVSLGGLQICSQDSFQPGDHLLVMNLWLDESLPQPFVFTTQVRWAESDNRAAWVRYGCSFEQMSTWEEDRLCNAIFNLQRDDIAAH
jgi:hypothetical protein